MSLQLLLIDYINQTNSSVLMEKPAEMLAYTLLIHNPYYQQILTHRHFNPPPAFKPRPFKPLPAEFNFRTNCLAPEITPVFRLNFQTSCFFLTVGRFRFNTIGSHITLLKPGGAANHNITIRVRDLHPPSAKHI